MKGEGTELLTMMKKTDMLCIPVYQRDYNWGKEQCKQLYDDLISLIIHNRKNHFFGSGFFVIFTSLLVTFFYVIARDLPVAICFPIPSLREIEDFVAISGNITLPSQDHHASLVMRNMGHDDA